MAINTEDRTQPRMRLYYAIMLGAFTISLGALILLDWTAFALIALASTAIVIIAAVRLGVAGPQVLVEATPGAVFSWRTIGVYTLANWRHLAAWSRVLIGLSVALSIFSVMPESWLDRTVLVGSSGLLIWFAFQGFAETRRGLMELSDADKTPGRLALKIAGGGVLVALSSVALGFLLLGEFEIQPQTFLVLLGVSTLQLLRRNWEKQRPTPAAPSPPAAG